MRRIRLPGARYRAAWHEFKESSTRFRYEKKFWKATTVVVVIISVKWPEPWAAYGTAYVAFVSNYALELTAHGGQKAAEAVEASNANTADAVDVAGASEQ